MPTLIQKGDVINEIIPVLEKTKRLQDKGQCDLSGKLTYAIGITLHKANKILKEFFQWRNERIKPFINYNCDSTPIIIKDDSGVSTYEFKSPETKVEWEKLYQEYCDEFVEFEFRSVHISEIEDQSENVPVDLIQLMVKMGSITELDLKNSLKKI